ncbi:hypothetical protein TNCV_1785781 [Trichonephila clavipes]|nr:hypothetical protein TNCV_1785781 [Trichonephila clavipes]
MDWAGWSSGKLSGSFVCPLLPRLLPLGPYEESCLRKPHRLRRCPGCKVAVIAGEIREMLGVFANVRHSHRRRCEACVFAGGRYVGLFCDSARKSSVHHFLRVIIY